MTVAIIHYHLGIGGVPNVIKSASRGLTKKGIKHVILCDDPPDPALEEFPIKQVEGLGYHAVGMQPDAEDVLIRMREVAKEALGEAPDVWHFHNHSLGKNAAMSRIVAMMAEQEDRLVLQIHDLAEDGRPENYALIQDAVRLYPFGGGIRYVFLNERDRKVLLNNGLSEEQAQLMVNPVVIPDEPSPQTEGDPILFAPVRAIRRKNIGELVFLAGLAPRGARIAVSRPPLGTRRVAIHETWKKFAAHQRLPIGFEVVGNYNPANGATSDFEDWVKHATHYITSSVAEGFGLPFIEAAAHGKPLIGRNIPHVTEQHKRHGIKAGSLYDQLLIPLEWVDVSMMRQHFVTTLERNYRNYGRILPKHVIEETFQNLIKGDWLDFGDLAEPLQQGVVERLNYAGCKDIPLAVVGEEKIPMREWFAQAIGKREPSVTRDQLKPYSEEVYADSLENLYGGLLEESHTQAKFLDAPSILSAHMAPDRFQYLCSAVPPKATVWSKYRAVIFDIYATLLIAPEGGVIQPDSGLDALMSEVLLQHGHYPPESPSQELHDAVTRYHEESEEKYPEVDLRQIWRGILNLDANADVNALVIALESQIRPSQLMPGAANFIRRLAHSGVSLGLLSNAQCNTLPSLGGIREFFAPELILLSYLEGKAKPSEELFRLMADRLATRGIKPEETLMIGNDPMQDITPAKAVGFKTALFTGHPDSYREGACKPDHEIREWPGSKK